MKRIAVLTSGGDAPGMNPAIRAVVRSAIGRGIEVIGVRRGYRGLYENDMDILDSRSVSGIINAGGTMLKSIRFPRFTESSVRRTAEKNLADRKIEGLVVIGGNGSACGARAIHRDAGIPVVVIPASIDNDIYGTDSTVGFDTAVNTAVEAIDKIRDTATSHDRTFIIEVMGRDSGNLAMEIGIACGAEIVLAPEIPFTWPRIFAELEEQVRRGKVSSLIVLAEGAGSAPEAAAVIQQHFPKREIRFSVLGYIQRGGNPTALTRVLAVRFGSAAVSVLVEKAGAYLVGIQGGKLVPVPLSESTEKTKTLSTEQLELVKAMAI